ncbi:MAG: penicillin acylase family protein [Acidobacteriota bacterium]
MRAFAAFLFAAVVLAGATRTADVIVYGCTSGAITTAIQARKMGKSTMMVCPEKHLGGLTSGGLGWTDSGNKAVIGGLSREFYHRVWKHYQRPEAWRWQKREEYGNKGQGTEALDNTGRTMWIFEPHVAEAVYEEWIRELKIPVYRDEWLDRSPGGVKMSENRIRSIRTLGGNTYRGQVFVDATYEGDLMAAAKVDFHVGRESMQTYGEKWAGVQTGVLHHRHHFGAVAKPISPYRIAGDPSSGVLPRISTAPPGKYGEGDDKVQAYCFRMCLTRVAANRVPFPKPAKYDANEYELLLRIFEAGWRETFQKFDAIPNAKTDTNNHGPFSTDNIGRNYDYPNASYERRKEIIDEHIQYQQGWLYFIANDPRVPADVRTAMAEWGLAKDEFLSTNHWPQQMYVREARRMIGRYVMTENELVKRRPTPEPVGMGSYSIDSHNIQRYITPEGYVQNEGDIGVSTNGPYQISYGSLVPKKGQAGNLLVPVCLSTSHIAYGSIRMEPVFMILGQSAGTAAALAIDGKMDVQDVPYERLRAKLLADGQVLEYQAARPQARIVRDKWGIAHVYGKTDADAVFGAMYAQAEDDFPRIEQNYLTALGRLAEAEGEEALSSDLRTRLYVDEEDLKKRYGEAPGWLKKLMEAWAAGLNHFLEKNPGVKPRVLRRFEPWMSLSFTEGSIGGDIERIELKQLGAFYDAPAGMASLPRDTEPRGSNGIAIAPALTRNKAALLLINPHTSFYFRSEMQMNSEEGLNAYGAATWGQFFLYQGFNNKAGWRHTSSGADTIDEYLETVSRQGAGYVYRHGEGTKPVRERMIRIGYRTRDGGQAERRFKAYFTHHGPVTRKQGERWVATALMFEPVKALTQSFLRIKSTNYQSFLAASENRTNSSNNTIFADAEGNIAYLHVHYMPRREDRFDWSKPVDGADPATDYRGLHELKELPLVLNPRNGWLYNTNNWPWSAAGADSPKAADYPKYVDRYPENARGIHAIRVLSGKTDFTIESLREAAYDSYLPWFEGELPALFAAFAEAPEAGLAEPLAVLKQWDLRWSTQSVATSLGIFYGEELRRLKGKAEAAQRREALRAAVAKLTRDFGAWRTPWGEINRFQRIRASIEPRFDDGQPSIAVGFPSGNYGSLASYGARAFPNTKKMYGTSGNSFVAIVEFGPRVRAVAVNAGGQSGDAASTHFRDQAERYAAGDLRPVYFYPEEVEANKEKEYRVQ